MPPKPVVMCFSGLDSSGGAGISADVETLFSLGCHCAPVVSALTVQNSWDAQEMQTLPSALLLRQARAVLEDMQGDTQVKCFKVGLLGNVGIIEAVHELLREYAEVLAKEPAEVPVVIDPVLRAGGGFAFADSAEGGSGDGKEQSSGMQDIIAAIARLLSLCTVLTPNIYELQQLAEAVGSDSHESENSHEPTGSHVPADNLDTDPHAAAAGLLLAAGCKHILLTGSHDDSEAVVNRLYTAGKEPLVYDWPRLPAEYHGSGCTLAAALAGYLARGDDAPTAAAKAQQFTFAALKAGWQPGRGQHFPNRGFDNT